MSPLPHRAWATRLALLACLLAAGVPSAGLVLCFHGGLIDFQVGIGDDCPCGLPDGHGDCNDLALGGDRDLTPASPVLDAPGSAGFVELLALPVPPEWTPIVAGGARAPPARSAAAAPRPWTERAWSFAWMRRHVAAREATLLLI